MPNPKGAEPMILTIQWIEGEFVQANQNNPVTCQISASVEDVRLSLTNRKRHTTNHAEW